MTPAHDPARWNRVSSLFDTASLLPPEEHEAFLRRECPDDTSIRDEVMRMLETLGTTGVLDRPIVPVPHPRVIDATGIAGQLGRALRDRYVLGRALGSGGMGAVFLARERKHDREVVIKVLRPDVMSVIGPVRFEAEVRIAAQLSHPHIIPLIDSGAVDGLHYYVMPHHVGETLRERLDRDGNIPLLDALRLLRDIADALAHAHRAGVVHRDLKPENILCAGVHAYLLDFGIAQWGDGPTGDRLTGEGILIGTPRYMAPEQAAGLAVDHRADLYALGLVGREMTGGRAAGAPATTPNSSNPPKAVTLLLDQCLAANPDARPARAEDVVASLDAILDGDPALVDQ